LVAEAIFPGANGKRSGKRSGKTGSHEVDHELGGAMRFKSRSNGFPECWFKRKRQAGTPEQQVVRGLVGKGGI